MQLGSGVHVRPEASTKPAGDHQAPNADGPLVGAPERWLWPSDGRAAGDRDGDVPGASPAFARLVLGHEKGDDTRAAAKGVEGKP
jgi:hypothetical protein